jgi:hypothetical protein
VLALRRAPGARSFSTVFDGQVTAFDLVVARRLRTAVLAGFGLSQLACPHESPLEPAGEVLAVRSALVGSWICTSDDYPDWRAALIVGRQSTSVYQLTVRPEEPPERGADELPWIVFARPRQVSGREIWSVWKDGSGDSSGKFSFVRLERARADTLKLSSLGGGGLLRSLLDGESPRSVARILADSKQTVPEGAVTCRRTSG